MERGNPADATKAIPMLERHRALMGKAPEQVAFDAGFTSTANIATARTLGVKPYAWASVLCTNLLLMARRTMA